MKNSAPLLLSQFAVWRINGTVVPLYDTLGVEAIAYMSESPLIPSHVCFEAELKTVLCNPASAALLLRSITDFPDKFVTVKNVIVVVVLGWLHPRPEARSQMRFVNLLKNITLLYSHLMI